MLSDSRISRWPSCCRCCAAISIWWRRRMESSKLMTNCWHCWMPSLFPARTLRSSQVTLTLLAGNVALNADTSSLLIAVSHCIYSIGQRYYPGKDDKCLHDTAIGGSLIPPARRECHNCGILIPLMRIDATIGVAYYPFMAPMPQWELPHTKVEQAQRTVGL